MSGSHRAVLSGLMDSYFIVDDQRQLKEHNRSFLELSGSRTMSVRDGVPVHCHDRVRLEICQKDCIALRALKAGRAVHMQEIRGKALDGRDLVLMGSATPLQDANGTVTSVLVIYRDVTEETQLRERFHQLQHDAKQEKDVLLRNLTEKTQELDELKRELDKAKRRPPT